VSSNNQGSFSIHPLVFFIVVLLTASILVFNASRKLYELQKIAFSNSKPVKIDFAQFDQNFAILKKQGRASPNLKKQILGEEYPMTKVIKESMTNLTLLLFGGDLVAKKEMRGKANPGKK
jgi:hypothetical protein